MQNEVKILPQSIDTEKAVLSSMMQDENALAVGLNLLNIDCFMSGQHKWIFRAMQKLQASNSPVDQLTITEMLMSGKKLDKIGGPQTISDIANRVPSASNIEHYAKIVRDKWTKRLIIGQCDLIKGQAYDEDEEDGGLSVMDRAIDELINARGKSEFNGPSKLDMVGTVETAEMISTDPEKAGITYCGLSAVDKLVHGFRGGETVVIAARPGMGKSALALAITRRACKRGKGVAFFSLEMSREDLAMRLLSAESGVYHNLISDGGLQAQHYGRLNDGAAEIDKYNLFTDETPNLSPMNILTRMRTLIARENVDLVVVDYMQIASSEKSYKSKNEEVAAISKGLHDMAKFVKKPVIVLSQLNRGNEMRADKRPTLHDLRDSGAIEQDADTVIFIYREGYYTRDADSRETELICAKHRRGKLGVEKCAFYGEYMDFRDYDYAHTEVGHDEQDLADDYDKDRGGY